MSKKSSKNSIKLSRIYVTGLSVTKLGFIPGKARQNVYCLVLKRNETEKAASISEVAQFISNNTIQLQYWLCTRWRPFRGINGLKGHQKINTRPRFLYTKNGFLCSPDLDPNADPPQSRIPDIGPLEQPGPKFRTSVKQKIDPMFCGLTFNKACQKCISANANCLRQQARKLCSMDEEIKSKPTGRNCIDGLYKYSATVQQPFFAINKSAVEKGIKSTTQNVKILAPSYIRCWTFFLSSLSAGSPRLLPYYVMTA